MALFDLHIPTRIFTGPVSPADIFQQVRSYGRKVLLLISENVFKEMNGTMSKPQPNRGQAIAEVHSYLLNKGCTVHVRAVPGSLLESQSIDEIAASLKGLGVQVILAMGGGKILDCAKALGVLIKDDSNEGIVPFLYKGPKGQQIKHIAQCSPIIAVPTIFGTGSESSDVAVVHFSWPKSMQGKRRKSALFSEKLRPKAAFISSLFCGTEITVPQWQTQCFDTLAHLWDPFLSESTEYFPLDHLTLQLSKDLLQIMAEWSRTEQQSAMQTNQLAERFGTISAIALSGFFSGRKGGWPLHAIEHGLSSQFQNHHAKGLQFLIPRALQHRTYALDSRICSINEFIWGRSHDSSIQIFLDFLNQYQLSIHWNNVSDIALTEKIDSVIEHIFEIDGIWAQGQETPYLSHKNKLTPDCVRTILLS